MVSGIKVAAKILWQENKTNDDASDYVSHDHLQEGKVGIVGEARNADDGQRTGFCRDNRQCDCPPRNVAVGEKIVAHRPLPFAKAQPEQRDPRQIDGNNDEVDRTQSQTHPSVETRRPRLRLAALYRARSEAAGERSRVRGQRFNCRDHSSAELRACSLSCGRTSAWHFTWASTAAGPRRAALSVMRRKPWQQRSRAAAM